MWKQPVWALKHRSPAYFRNRRSITSATAYWKIKSIIRRNRSAIIWNRSSSNWARIPIVFIFPIQQWGLISSCDVERYIEVKSGFTAQIKSKEWPQSCIALEWAQVWKRNRWATQVWFNRPNSVAVGKIIGTVGGWWYRSGCWSSRHCRVIA